MIKKMILVLIISSLSLIQAQQKTITGVVSDESGPLPGVSILVKGTINGVETDFDGKYSISASSSDILKFSFVGMKTEERKVGNKKVINVLLTSDNLLEEVVVTSISTKSTKKYSTASVSLDSDSESTYSGTRSGPQSGQLTAGEINDIIKWKEWNALMDNDKFLTVKNDWEFCLGDQLEVKVNDLDNNPINNATVLLYDHNYDLINKSKTDVFGSVVLQRDTEKSHIIQVIQNKKVKGLRINKNHKKVILVFDKPEKSDDIDVMFTIDATGSMGDEIDYLKSEIENIITRVDTSIRKKRIGLTFYRDFGDNYVTKDFDFTSDVSNVKENLSKQNADGGGDYEEAVEKALEVSLSKSWDLKAKSRLLFLLLDAPPHLNQENVKTIKEQISLAQEKGIKIIPIVASGADKTVEFLMRYFSVSTNGTYVFLTDDSGIGNSHLKPSSDDYKVEKLNDLIVRLIEKYAGI